MPLLQSKPRTRAHLVLSQLLQPSSCSQACPCSPACSCSLPLQPSLPPSPSVVSQAANQSNRAVGRCAISTGPRDSVDSRLSARRSVHSQLGPRASIQSRLGPRFEEPHEQHSGHSIHSRLGPQGALSMSLRRMQRGAGREAATRSASSSTGSPRGDPSPARQTRTPLPQRRQIRFKPSLQVRDLLASGLKLQRSGSRDVRPLQSSKFRLQIF